MIAKTDASGGSKLLPEVLAYTSSLVPDRQILREDLVGSLAHLIMLARRGILPKREADVIRGGLVWIWERATSQTLELPAEEDVHMAVEGELTRMLGETAGLLHTARSRNDQIALDLRLHVREMAAELTLSLATLLETLVALAEEEKDTLLPAYTHRQRAQPISAAYLLAGYGAMFVRDLDALVFVHQQSDAMPLGVGAIAGTSLPTDRDITRTLLGFSRLTENGLDTVGDRDFALDFLYAASKCHLHASRVSADFVDFSSSEFGFVHLEGEIACGSSMMPQKRNPDVFELIRGKAGRPVGNLVNQLVTVKGLPGGYNRDLQEDRAALLETGPHLGATLSVLNTALKRVRFDRERCFAALARDYTQATDLAELLVQRGIPFRTAYKAVGSLVSQLQAKGLPLAAATLDQLRSAHPAFDEAALAVCDVRTSVGRKVNLGGTGPDSVDAQLAALKSRAAAAREQAASWPRLHTLFQSLREASL